ncbi:MAG: bifunctional folylpolyglutamate synthase/dihydrofolate synthase [Bacteroidales bacterium]|nr:bifunctional folylpolyglutamate synthase/dihydrofolate synthase [Bacteroidales bacterium]
MVDQVKYEAEIQALFQRFPSVQQVPFGDAYKPGLAGMEAFAQVLGQPHRHFRSIHVAGTNGKGSVSSMLASVLMANGYKTGLYTSPHLLDFRERMKVDGQVPSREWVYDFICRYRADFERLHLSFFEITTGMAFRWFADQGCDWAVVEVGLGGRLDSTNIILPELAVVTSIGLDHMAYLGNTLSEIAGEKAGIFKEGIPAVVGEVLPETEPVFRAKARGPLVFAQRTEPPLWEKKDLILSRMDLHGAYQEDNLRTVLAALDILGITPDEAALEHTAARTGLRGRWEQLSDHPLILCDIGHNAHALRRNFAQLEAMGRPMRIVYAVMADKDLSAILPLMPAQASYYFATPDTARALPAERILEAVAAFRGSRAHLSAWPSVAAALQAAREDIPENAVIYIGGSTFAVADAIKALSS